MIIHQAVFGIKSGKGHGLIERTIDSDLLYELKTDFMPTIDSHSNWKPFLRTEIIGDYFTFSKTFPDDTQDRLGSVFTHVLIIDKSDVCNIENLKEIFNLFKSQEEFTKKLKSIEIEPSSFKEQKSPALSTIVNRLVNTFENNAPIIWLDEDNFESIIAQVWSILPQKTRQTFKFQYAPSPQDLKYIDSTIVYTKKKNGIWKGFNLISINDKAALKSNAELYLLNQEPNNPISKFLSDSLIELQDLKQLKHIDQSANAYYQLGKLDFDETLTLVRRLIKLAPAVPTAKKIKLDTLNHLKNLMSNQLNLNLKGLRNIKFSSFENGISVVKNALTKNFLSELNHNQHITHLADLIKISHGTNPDNQKHWWYISIKNELTIFFSNWDTTASKVTWNLWLHHREFIDILKEFFPKSQALPTSLITHIPKEIPKKTGLEIADLAKNKNWYALHATIILRYFSILEVIKRQLLFDKNDSNYSGLDIIRKQATNQEMLEATLKYNDKRLIEFAGKACFESSSLFKNIDIANLTWQKIWLKKIENSSNVWEGITKPNEKLYQILDLVIENRTVDEELISRISQSNYNSLLFYPKRAEVWSVLSFDLRNNFLEGTKDEWYKMLTPLNLTNAIESALKAEILKYKNVQSFIGTCDSLQLMIRFYENFGGITENDFVSIIKKWKYKSLSSNETTLLGQLALKNDWGKLMSSIIDVFNKANNLKYAIAIFYEKLSWRQRIWLRVNGYSKKKITSSEWWNFLYDLSTQLYKKGIQDRKIWLRAGGDFDTIPPLKDYNTEWLFALATLKSGGGGMNISVRKLLKEMIEDNKNNKSLKWLKDNYDSKFRGSYINSENYEYFKNELKQKFEKNKISGSVEATSVHIGDIINNYNNSKRN